MSSYFAANIGNVADEIMRQYIENQDVEIFDCSMEEKMKSNGFDVG